MTNFSDKTVNLTLPNQTEAKTLLTAVQLLENTQQEKEGLDKHSLKKSISKALI
ncbi:MAG: hypothetical protein HC784_09520 [Hydrococcus sp. CSU_1_8]|nr:hypothetical protein [Hydrococcus sp. CSU_1_8]